MFRIFIGWDSRFPEPADVLAFSLRKHSTIALDIRYLRLNELRLNRQRGPLDSAEFTFSRFLVPHLCDYRGTALYLDSTALCLSDIHEIAGLPMESLALRVVNRDCWNASPSKSGATSQSTVPRNNLSSMMLLNCERLTLWTKDVVETATIGYLDRFEDIQGNQIGDLPKSWNWLGARDHDMKFVYWSSAGPWLEQSGDCPHRDVWLKARDEMRAVASHQSLPSIRARRAIAAPLSVSMPNGVSPIAR